MSQAIFSRHQCKKQGTFATLARPCIVTCSSPRSPAKLEPCPLTRLYHLQIKRPPASSTCSGVAWGKRESSMAAAPATCGTAMLVPLDQAYAASVAAGGQRPVVCCGRGGGRWQRRCRAMERCAGGRACVCVCVCVCARGRGKLGQAPRLFAAMLCHSV
jgi:hypothetical protein